MANRRMFSCALVGSARFLQMGQTARLLYYDLGMMADDSGIVEAFTVMRMTGANEDDLKLLAEKGFIVILNADLVSYICDWSANNMIRGDRRQPSLYAELLEQYQTGRMIPFLCAADRMPTGYPPVHSQPSAACQPSDSQPSAACQPSDNQTSTNCQPSVSQPSAACQPSDNQPSTNCQPSDNQMSTNCQPSIGKDRLGKDRSGKDRSGKDRTDQERTEEAHAPHAVRHKYGRYQNVYLTDEEMDTLKAEFPSDWQLRIETVSEYVASSGKHYKNFLAVIRAWARKDQKSAPQIPKQVQPVYDLEGIF